MPASVLAKIRAEALAMPLWQLGLRTALEVGMQLVLWQIARSVIRGLSNRGQQVSATDPVRGGRPMAGRLCRVAELYARVGSPSQPLLRCQYARVP